MVLAKELYEYGISTPLSFEISYAPNSFVK